MRLDKESMRKFGMNQQAEGDYKKIREERREDNSIPHKAFMIV